VTSLPGKYGIGDLGPAAHRWIDMLAAARQSWWQMLPLGPCGEGNSPYRCYSAFAGNPLLISPDRLVEQGLLRRSEIDGFRLPNDKVDYAKVARNKMAMLSIAYKRFRQKKSDADFYRFTSHQAGWLDDFALFMTLQQTSPEQSWTHWPAPLLRRKAAALKVARATHTDAIDFHKFVQFLFFDQLRLLRDHARAARVALIGDLPIFVSPESADVWANPELFQLDNHLRPSAVSGVPPDLFSATGQCWGNPLYNWKAMANDHFGWWKARLASALSQADLVRIDHFRGFESYWKIPADAPTAQRGKWVKAPGARLFEALLEGNSTLPLVAEDLGMITPEVEMLRDRFDLPGMRVLQFGFSAEPGNPHAPHNFIHHCFAYTGTHDNETTMGWYKSLSAEAQRRLEKYAPHSQWKADPSWALIRLLMGSVAGHAIIPLQDLLGLDSKSRMNIPGQSRHNWEWRLSAFSQATKPLADLADMADTYDRNL
jgi:4-alpha-glucanotransferase